MKKVYLSGGLASDWQNVVMDTVTEAEIYNPKDLEFEGAERWMIGAGIYSPMNLIALKEADIVFGYLEEDNPTPINTVFELGTGAGLGKITIFVDEWTGKKELPTGEWYKDSYLEMVRERMTFVESDFGRAMEILKNLVTSI